MLNVTTLSGLIEANRTYPGAITYLEGENDTRSVEFAELYERALGILHRLQRLGASPGDTLILFLEHNEQFIDAFWAAVLGGIIPVPVALGISDEHRHKLLRIARPPPPCRARVPRCDGRSTPDRGDSSSGR